MRSPVERHFRGSRTGRARDPAGGAAAVLGRRKVRIVIAGLRGADSIMLLPFEIEPPIVQGRKRP